MKKHSKIFLIISLVAACLLATGCAAAEKISELLGPKDKFQEFEYKYEYKDTELYLTCYFLYSDTGCSKTKTGKTIDCPAGLTVCVVPTASKNNASLIEELFGQAMEDYYVMKTFGKGESISLNNTDDDANEKSFKLGFSTWAILYNSVEMTDCGDVLPSELANRTSIDAGVNFNWKKLMYTVAINKLGDLLGAE